MGVGIKSMGDADHKELVMRGWGAGTELIRGLGIYSHSCGDIWVVPSVGGK